MGDFSRQLLTSSPAVIYTCKVEGDYGTTFITDNIETLLGYTSEEFLSDPGFWLTCVHPDDLEQVLSGANVVFKTGHYVCECRLKAKNGEYVWMRDEARLIHNELTNTNKLVGSLLDINDRK